MKLVVALGGNALLRRGEPMEQQVQTDNIDVAARVIARASDKHQLVITHGNGPQVGLLALQNDAYKGVSPYTLDVLGAETEGMIGYLLAQGLRNHSKRDVIAMLTQTRVNIDDPAFRQPTKFVGPIYDEDTSRRLAAEKGWRMRLDGDAYRRVVPSPRPLSIVEEPIIRQLIETPELLVVCTGGGGVPVIEDKGLICGVEAVVDKDAASNVLGKAIGAEGLIMLTDVECVESHFHQPGSRRIHSASPDAMTAFSFATGSMGPKVEAACDFVRSGGLFAAIGALSDLDAILKREKGTFIVNDENHLQFYED
ncbi:Carbamate kinase 1 [BD1-7 clade bacterium]|uniref:Carbamate kinase n=1 Tax=BD1-7 clade bacterium TaxID=2029982 RepID=A0A5S9QG63_9GAMM|nr:Carbamate kinase 1 [BD1-7 clade bacterium]CAA0116438.1 Carbamate kinase 1 [BD1-7 clade bacterium]CAA0120092.1 Carbamate kinase 1 [BD1-7 clade bacterium]